MENLEEPSSVGRSHFSLGVGVDPSAPTATPPIHRRGIHASPSLGQRARQQQEPTAPDGKPEGEARYGAVPVSVRAKGLLRQANKAPPGVQQWGREGGLSGRGSRPNSWASSDPPSIDGGNAQDAVPKSQRSAKKENNAPKTEAERVRVVLRVRPPIRPDESPGSLEILSDGASVKLHRQGAVVPETTYTYDRVLGPESTQADMYEAAVAPVIADVMNGYNGTIMAYGQTGAGKTHTLSSIQPDNIGMMPRAAAEVFVQANSDPSHDYVVLMSYVQIYMELIQDLLRPESENLVIRENESGVFISGVQEVQVKKMEDCLQLLQLGERNRAFAFTELNAHSSRSHAIVLLTILKRKKAIAQTKSSKVKVGKLFIVDLAGSERLKKSKSEGQRQREAKSINLSLTTLGMCINARADPNCLHVPFRDSKLTRLLQESLGGNAKTSLVLAAADVREHAEETQQSLQFGSRAMCVKTHPVVNEQVDYKAMHAEVLAELDQIHGNPGAVEATLLAKDEEMAKLQDAMRKEQERNLAIMRALEKEKQELDAMRQREAEHLEGMLREKQDEIERHQTDLKFSVAELEQRDKEISDRETRLEVLINTLKDKDSLLRKFREEKERLAHELQASKVETQGLKVQHDQEMEILLRQWHAEKAARTKQLKRAETEARDLAARHENEKTAFVGELDRVREGQSTLLMHWQTEVAALVSLLVMDAESSAAVCGGNVPEADDAVHAVRELQRALGVSPSDLQDGAEIEAAAVRADEVHLALKATQAATEARREALEAFWGEQGGAKAAIDLEAVQAEAAELRDRLTTSEAEAEEALRGLQDLQSRWEADLKAARAEASAASMGLRVAEKERNRLKEDMAAAASKQQRLEAALDQEREALVRCWQEERVALERQLDAAQRQAKEQPAEFERKYEELVKEVEEQRKNTGHTMAGLRTKLRAAEEAAFAAREAAKGEIYEALSESEAQHSKRTQKMEELAQKRRQRELKAAQQRHDAAMEELKTKHTAELESLTAQLRTALIERDAASGDEQRHLSARHAEEIRALKKDFKAEIAMAREHWARKHEEEAAALAEKHANDLRQVQEASYQRELSVQHMYATELAAERESFASKLSEQHTLMLGSSQTSVAHERAIWEGRLAEAERQAHQAASAAEAAMSQEREKLKDLAAKHHLAIQALKKHHKAELGRVQSSMQERHNADLSKSHHSFQSELSNLSFNVQAEGTELASKVNELRNGMEEVHRSAGNERERLLASLEQQTTAANKLRAEKEEMLMRLHATETEVHNTKMQLEASKQHMEMEVRRMAAEAELAKERLTNQGNLDRDTLIHKHNLEVQALRESLRQTEERLGQTKREAEEEKRHLVAEQEEIKSKLAEVEAGAMAARRRLEDMVEEARGNLETLEADHREVMVEKGLLIGANKSLNERVEGLLSLLEERQAHSEAQMAALKADHQAALENRQNEHNRRITDMTRQVKELEEDMQTKQRLQAMASRRNAAASVIQRRFRQAKLAAVVSSKFKTEEELNYARRQAEELDRHRMLLEAQRISGMALTGQQLVQHTFVVAQNTINDLLTAFLVPKKDLESAEKFNRTRDKLTTPSMPDVGSIISSIPTTPGGTPRHSYGGLPPAASANRRVNYGTPQIISPSVSSAQQSPRFSMSMQSPRPGQMSGGGASWGGGSSMASSVSS